MYNSAQAEETGRKFKKRTGASALPAWAVPCEELALFQAHA